MIFLQPGFDLFMHSLNKHLSAAELGLILGSITYQLEELRQSDLTKLSMGSLIGERVQLAGRL